MELTERHIKLLGIIGFALVVFGTPLTGIYALDYRMSVVPEPEWDPPLYQHTELSGEREQAVDATLAGEGPWYRTRAQVPFNRIPIRIFLDGQVYTIGLTEQYHWGAWYGKLPLVTLIVGLVCIAITLRNRIRNRGAVPVRR